MTLGKSPPYSEAAPLSRGPSRLVGGPMGRGGPCDADPGCCLHVWTKEALPKLWKDVLDSGQLGRWELELCRFSWRTQERKH